MWIGIYSVWKFPLNKNINIIRFLNSTEYIDIWINLVWIIRIYLNSQLLAHLCHINVKSLSQKFLLIGTFLISSFSTSKEFIHFKSNYPPINVLFSFLFWINLETHVFGHVDWRCNSHRKGTWPHMISNFGYNKLS